MHNLSMTSLCRYCGAEIKFIRTTGGRFMPVDLEPVGIVEAGGPDTFITGGGIIVRGYKSSTQEIIAYRSHFASCPGAAKARKSDRKRKRMAALAGNGHGDTAPSAENDTGEE